MAKNEMRAVAIDRFGGPETLSVKSIPIPEPKVDQVLIRVGSAGLGVWDIGEREGYIARMYEHKPTFPYVLGTEGAGKVTAVGEKVKNFRKGDLVYGLTWGTNPKAGFDAEYVAVGADWISPIPSNLPIEQAGALMIDGAVALRGLDEILKLKGNENLLVFGASGGVGHLAVQIGVRMGAHVFAVSSGDDGVKLARRLVRKRRSTDAEETSSPRPRGSPQRGSTPRYSRQAARLPTSRSALCAMERASRTRSAWIRH